MKDRPVLHPEQLIITVGDFSILKDNTGKLNAYTTDSINSNTLIPCTIKGKSIDYIYLPQDHDLIILHTADGITAIDFENNIVDDPDWIDYYVEPISKQLFRKVKDQQWYDIQGFLLHPPIFISDDILICLPNKCSKKSISFRDQKLKTNPNNSLIQIGKLVFNADLKLLTYQGEKISAIKNKQIKLNDTIIQEIGIGKYKTGFINLKTNDPYSIQGELINAHIKSCIIGDYHFELFASGEKRFVVNAKTNQAITIDGVPVSLELDEYLLFGEYELLNGSLDGRDIVYNLKTQTVFNQKELIPYDISRIEINYIPVLNDKIINLNAGHHNYTYSIINHNLFTLNSGDIAPQKIESLDEYTDYYGKAFIEGSQRIFYLDSCSLIGFDNSSLYIQSILDTERHKLINALDSHNEPVVLDARNGYQKLTLATVESQQIRTVLASSKSIGVAKVHNAVLNSIGGDIERAIRIDTDDISLFTLDSSIKSFPDGDHVSVFAGNPIVSIDFENPIYLGEDAFLKIVFIPYHEIPTSGFIYQSTGKLLIIEGEANRHEVVTDIPQTPIMYQLGEHELIQVKTLTEDFKDKHILMCQQTKKSWLRFYDDYLPALESHVVSDSESTWEYQLFKVRSNEKESRFLVSEKHAPYRILVEETQKRIVPKLIKSNDQVLKEPKRRSRFAKLFLDDPGFLR